jgi:hypothetical protein
MKPKIKRVGVMSGRVPFMSFLGGLIAKCLAKGFCKDFATCHLFIVILWWNHNGRWQTRL